MAFFISNLTLLFFIYLSIKRLVLYKNRIPGKKNLEFTFYISNQR